MSGCYYISLSGQAFGYTQLIPLFFITVMFFIKMVTRNWIWVIFGFWLYLPQYIMWLFQRYFQYVRPDPICAVYQSFAFPSIESFYIGVAVGLFVVYTFMHEIEQSWFAWTLVFVACIVFPVILLMNEFNVWWEVLFSIMFGFVCSWIFVLIYEYFIVPRSKYLTCFFPFWHFGYVHDEQNAENKNVLEVLERLDNNGTKNRIPV